MEPQVVAAQAKWEKSLRRSAAMDWLPARALVVHHPLGRAQKFDGTECETLQIGTGFGTTPSIEQGPDGNLYVVSVTDNAIYKISRRP